MTDNKIHIMLVDDHAVMREGLHMLLEKEHDMLVVAEASNGREAVRKAQRLDLDVVVMDIGMSDLNGIDATRQIRSKAGKTKVLCLSMHKNRAMIKEMLSAGASGYLLKTSAGKELAEAVRTVAAGQTYLSPSIAGVLVDLHLGGEPDRGTGGFGKLTMREREVLQLIAEGHNTRAIADRLYISPKTVLSHRERIMRKLDVDTIAGLTRYALRQGIAKL
jgi:DNA-binding NarL/FixJ family response regulator